MAAVAVVLGRGFGLGHRVPAVELGVGLEQRVVGAVGVVEPEAALVVGSGWSLASSRAVDEETADTDM